MKLGVYGAHPIWRDLSLLAFVKCHLTDVTRWNVLRALIDTPEGWAEARRIARAIHQPTDVARVALDALVEDGLIRSRPAATGPAYRLDPADPTSLVVVRLVDAARRDQHLRWIIARVLSTGAPAELAHPAEYARPRSARTVEVTARNVA